MRSRSSAVIVLDRAIATWSVGIGSPMRMVTQPAAHLCRAKRQHFARALQSDRNQRNSRANRDVGRAFLEGRELAGVRAPALGKDEQRDAAFADYLRGRGHGLHRRAGVVARNGDVAGARQVRSEQRNLEQSALGEKTELHRNVCENHRRIHVAEMIGDENVASVGCNFLQALDFHLHSAHPQQDSAPRRAPPRSACGRWSQTGRSPGSPDPKAMVARTMRGAVMKYARRNDTDLFYGFYFTSSARASPAR